MKSVITIVFFLIFFRICPAISQDLEPANKTERKVIQLIKNLPEIIKDNKYMTQKGRPYQIYLENTAGDIDGYYHVVVSEFNGVNLVPHFRYLVKPKTYAIFYVDFWNDNWQPIPLNVWRKRKASNNL